MADDRKVGRLLNVLICDDVRREVTGKEIIIGVYGDEMMVPSLPVSLNLSLWIRVFFENAEAMYVDFAIVGEGGINLVQPQRLPIAGQQANRQMSVVLSGIPIQVQMPGPVTFRWCLKGGSWEDLATVRV